MTWQQIGMGVLGIASFVAAGFLVRAGMATEGAMVAGFGGTVLGLLSPQIGGKKP